MPPQQQNLNQVQLSGRSGRESQLSNGKTNFNMETAKTLAVA